MNLRLKGLVLVALAICLSPLARPALADDVIARFVTAGRLQFAGMPRLVLKLDVLTNNRTINVGVPNQDEKKAYFDPNPQVLGIVKSLKAGDVVKVSYTMQNNVPMVQTVAVYPLKPGEDLPNAFVFNETYPKKEGKVDYQMIDAKKFDQTITFQLPNKKDSSGDMSPDPDLLADANKLKTGDVVLIDALNTRPRPTLKSIEVYTAPQEGHFVKSSEQEVEAGEKTTAAEIEADGKTISALVPGHLDGKKWVVDAKVLALVKRLRPNVDVMFRAVDDNGKMWLRDIEMAPKQTHTSSNAKAPAADAKPPADAKPAADAKAPKEK